MTQLDPEHLFAIVRPSIVSIRSGTSTGTGFCAAPSGVIVSNAHVVGYAREVVVYDEARKESTARVFAVDMRLDVALLAPAPAPTRRPPLVLGDSAAVRVGAPVLAIGDPLGLPRTATRGIVSAVNRVSSLTGVTYLQTDAALNPGNSGGPLLDGHGRVVGINTFGFSEAEGLGFALPIDAIRELLRPYEAALPASLPEPIYRCRICAHPEPPTVRWCSACGVRLGFASPSSPGRDLQAGSFARGLLAALGFDPAGCSVADDAWRIEANGAEVWVDVSRDGRVLAFSARIGVLPVDAPLPVLRFLATANDRSVGPCRLTLDRDTIIAEAIEPIAFATPADTATTLGQLLALAAELRSVLASEFGVSPPRSRLADDRFVF